MSRPADSYVTLKNLDKLMKAAGASNVALSAAAGVSLTTVALARCGKRRTEPHNAEAILQALAERKFIPQKLGRRPKDR